jgi:hypothetical protein
VRFWYISARASCGTLLVAGSASAIDLEWSAPELCSEAVGASCADVSRAGAVAVAMAIHSHASELPAVERLEAPEDGTSPASASEISSPKVLQPIAEQPYHFALQLLLLGDTSLLGTPTYGLGAGLAVTRGRWEAVLSGVVLPTVELRASDTLGMTLGAALGMASACRHLVGPPATPRVCLGYELGVLSGEGSGTGFVLTRERQVVWHALRPEIGLGVSLGPALELRLLAGAALALTRATFVFDDGRVGHEVPRVSARGTIGLVWTL